MKPRNLPHIPIPKISHSRLIPTYFYFILMISTLTTGCATLSNRQKTLLGMAAAGVVGTVVGTVTTPSDGTVPLMHGLYFGGLSAAAAGAAGLFIFDEEQKTLELERRSQVQQKEIDALRGEGGSSPAVLLHETNAPIGKDIPAEYKKLVTPGRWSLYQLNAWVPKGDGILVHEDKMLKLVPPQINLNAEGHGN